MIFFLLRILKPFFDCVQVTYNNLVDAYGRAGLFEEATKLLQEMSEQGRPPNAITYLVLISAYGNKERGFEAEALLKRMQEEKIEPDVRHYNGVILAYGKARKVDDLERIFSEMKLLGILPDLACYRTILKIYLEQSEFGKGLGLYEELRSTFRLDQNLYSIVVDLYRGAEKHLEADRLVTELESKGFFYKGKHGPVHGTVARVWRRSDHSSGGNSALLSRTSQMELI